VNERKINYDMEGKMPESVGERILLIRNEKRLTNKQVAELCSTSDTTVGKYISGENKPKLEFLQLFADRFNLRLDWLVYGTWPRERDQELGEKCRVICEDAAPDYERECLRLKNVLADTRIELSEVREAKGKQQSLIFAAVDKACKDLGLSPAQTMTMHYAVMDYENYLAGRSVNVADPETDLSHQAAVGDE